VWAFHSLLGGACREELAAAIETTNILYSMCPVYQNVATARFHLQMRSRKSNHTMAPVKWTQSVQQMIADGYTYLQAEKYWLDDWKINKQLPRKCMN
jgi:[acyl-carrier-protein] S-malonyltransferase